MTDDAFRVVTETDAVLAIDLGAHGLDGDAGELLAFVRSRLAGRHHDAVELDGRDAAIVTLEGIGVLVRLAREAGQAGTILRIVAPHEALDRKLRQTGTFGSLIGDAGA